MNTPDQHLDALPPLPQIPQLKALVTQLWQDDSVVALWLGGSIAHGDADAYSDVDLRIAVAPATFDARALPEAARAFCDTAVAHLALPFGPLAVLHHLLLPDGTFYDLLVQSTDYPLGPEPRLVLGCRDAAYAPGLLSEPEQTVSFPAATAEAILRIITDYWMGQQKHLRVLHRQLPLLSWDGEHRLRHELLRLWFIAATGSDCGPINRLTIHTFTPVARAIAKAQDGNRLAQLGQPLGTAAELITAARWSQAEAAHTGRELAARGGFTYPEALEMTVLRSWQKYLAKHDSDM